MKRFLSLRTLFTLFMPFCCLVALNSIGQGVGINSTGSLPHASSILDLNAAPTFDKGLLIPRMNEQDRDGILSPAAGLIVFNLTTAKLNYFNGTFWREVESYLSSTVVNTSPAISNSGVLISDVPVEPSASALLDVNYSGSPKRGLLLPRTTGASISSPAPGLLIFDPAGIVQFYDGSVWRTFCNAGNAAAAMGSQTVNGVAINTDGSAPDQSAALDIKSSSAGLLIPRLSSIQRDALPSPDTGLIIYNVTDNRVEYFDGLNWQYCLSSQPASVSAQASPNPVCAGANLSLAGTAQQASSWSWTGPDGFSSSDQSPVLSGVNTAAAGTYYVSATNTCGSAQAQVDVSVLTPPAQPGSISGNATVCRGNNGVAYSVSNSAGVTYTWTYTGTGLTVASGQSTSGITANFSASATSGTLTCTPSNVCGSGPARTFSVTVITSAPSQPSTITGVTIVCPNVNGIAYSVTNVAGTTYTWSYSGSGFSVASGQGTNSITADFSSTATSGTLTVTPSNSCGNGTARTLAITVGGGLITTFGTNGVVTQDFSTTSDRINAMAIDATGIYVAGYDWSPGNYQMRVQKRNLSTGATIWDKTYNGTNADQINAIAIDANAVYVGGFDMTASGSDYEWRIEKRDLTTGNLVTAFGVSGVIQNNKSGTNGYDWINAMTLDATGLYCAGIDIASSNEEWRIEKRNLTTGAVIWTVGSNPTTGSDAPRAIAVDATGVYIAGYDAQSRARIEKRDLNTGALITTFGTSGVVISHPSVDDAFYALTLDATGLYAAGYDNINGSEQWRIEKRNLSTGALDTSFGTGGVVTSNPSGFVDRIQTIAVDGTALYVGGYNSVTSSTYQWRAEKRSLTGVLQWTQVGTTSISNAVHAIVQDASGVYAAGRSILSSNNEQWRIEKYCK